DDEPLPPVIKTLDATTRQSYATQIRATMKSHDIPLRQSAYTALLRLYSQPPYHSLEVAYQLLGEAEFHKAVDMKLRMYSPLLEAYGVKANLSKCLELWRRLHQQQLNWSERDYLVLMKLALTQQHSKLLARVLAELAEDVLVPSNQTIEVVQEWFQSKASCFSKPTGPLFSLPPSTSTTTSKDDLNLPPTQAPSMEPVTNPHGWTIHSNIGITPSGTLKEPLGFASLRPYPLSEHAWQTLRDYNTQLATQGTLQSHKNCPYQGGGKGKKRARNSQKASEKWTYFQTWLPRQFPQGIDVVVDGANVGYYRQNFTGAAKHVSYAQMDALLDLLVAEKKKVLLVLHQRHLQPPLMPQWANRYKQKWSNYCFTTPFGAND
ncbi:MAG: hypothetical protein AAGJ35_14130, partial [Myxococcota bacterium]